MKFATLSAVVALVAATSSSSSSPLVAAQSTTSSSPAALLATLEALLSTSCKTALGELLATNSSLSKCIQIPELSPILANANSSVIPNVNTYLTGLCAADACTNATIVNATQTVLTGCATDLATFGIPESYVADAFGAYPTVREVACLATNGSAPISTLTHATIYNATTKLNSSLCVTDLLDSLQTYLGSPLTNTYVDTLLLGGNATAYDDILAIVSNKSLVDRFACNNCVRGAVDIVLENYPVLENLTFSLPLMDVYALTGNATYDKSGSYNFTVPTVYEAVCMAHVGYNISLPKSLNETAFNTTLPYNSTASSNKTVAARSIKFAREH